MLVHQFPWVYRDGEQTITELEISNEQSTAQPSVASTSPKDAFSFNCCLRLSRELEKYLFSQGTANCLSLLFTLTLQLQLIFISLMQEHCATAVAEDSQQHSI